MMDKQYLGDGVYVAWFNGERTLQLTTENGIEVTNSIVLEPEVMDALEQYWKRGHPVDRKERG